MGFFGLDDVKPTTSKSAGAPRGVSVELLHRTECKSCPLNHAQVKSPKIEPAGSKDPLIYVLMGAPSLRSDKTDKPIAGSDLQLIHSMMPKAAQLRTRYNTIIRTFPGAGPTIETKMLELATVRAPTFVEIECCRPSIVRDIEQSRPRAIFGFGGLPLKWAANETHAYQWMGRRIPVRIGSHVCWYYPFIEPNDALKDRRWEGHVSDNEFTMEKKLRAACRQVLNDDDQIDPVIHTPDDVFRDVSIVRGDGGKSDLRTIEKFLNQAVQHELVGMDYETNKLRPYNKDAKILTAALSIEESTLAFPFSHRQCKWTPGEADQLHDMFTEFLYDPRPRKIAHQLAFEMEWSAEFFGPDVLRAGLWGDSISQAYVIDETQGLLALEALTTQYFGVNIKDLSPVNRKDLDAEPLDKVLKYNGGDAKYHRLLYIEQERELRALEMQEVYEHQLRRVPTLVLTQRKGIPIDQDELKKFRVRFEDEIAEVEEQLAVLPEVKQYRQRYGAPYRPSAAQDLAKMLKLLGYTLSKTEKGGDATDEKNLRKYDDKVVKLTIKHRKASKILSTYVSPVSPGSEHLFDDMKIRPIISTYKVRTWRTSSEDPNIQNWPKRGVNVVIRKVVSAKRQRMKVVAFDYAGIQARNVAMESCDEALVKSFIDGYDIHKDWVENLAERYPKWAYKDLMSNPKVFKDARSGVKNQFVFPTFFGAAPKSIAVSLGGSGRVTPPVEVVEEMQEEFFERFPRIKEWHIRLDELYKRNGYVTGLSGHRRHAPISYNERINSSIQADESLIVLTAMSALSELDYKLYQPMMEIHDDLTFLWPEDQVDVRSDVVISEMTMPRFDWINVPLVVEMLVGDNWCDLEEVGSFENVGHKGDYRQLSSKG
jgi:DNA polymerase I-like protein with 3'-5' exonuclease and polymerase domains/uracil-DNA glycosylase